MCSVSIQQRFESTLRMRRKKISVKGNHSKETWNKIKIKRNLIQWIYCMEIMIWPTHVNFYRDWRKKLSFSEPVSSIPNRWWNLNRIDIHSFFLSLDSLDICIGFEFKDIRNNFVYIYYVSNYFRIFYVFVLLFVLFFSFLWA